MSRTARIALAAGAVFAVSGLLSGVLLDEYGGVAGALEWLLRTLVVVSGIVALTATFVLALRLRRLRPRPLGWALTLVAAAAFAFFIAQPAVFAVYLSHLPGRRAVHDVDLGAPKEPVTLTTASGLRLRGWYVPSRNGAAIALLHGTGSNRLGVTDHARLLARHGYGVLLFDFEGHGESDGRSTSLPWRLRQAAARHREWRATVLEGVQGASPADMPASDPDPASFFTLSGLYGATRVLSGSGPSGSNPDLIERVAPRPLLLLSAGRGTEARANEAYARRA